MNDLLDKILDGEPFMMVVDSRMKQALRRRMYERAREDRAALAGFMGRTH